MWQNRLGVEILEDRTVLTTASFVTALYANFLNRAPSPAELASYGQVLDAGVPPLTVAAAFANSDEFHAIQTRQAFESLLGREPSAAEVQAWGAMRQAGLTVQQETAALVASDEFFAQHGGTAAGWLNGLYGDVLHRAPDVGAQVAFFPLPLQNQAVRYQLASAIALTPEASTFVVDQAFEQILHRHPDGSGLSAWAAAVSSGLSVPQLLAELAVSPEFAATQETAFVTPAGTVTSTPAPAALGSNLITLNLNPLDLNLLGLEVQTSQIQVTVSAQPGQGQLLGNLLSTVSNLINLPGVNSALNNVLGSVTTLLNSASLSVSGVNTTSGPLSTSTTAATTPVLDLFVAPVHLNLLGALVDTSPIHLTITAHSGPGLVLGNLVTDLANLFNPPLPSTLTLATINAKLQDLLTQLNTQIPGIGGSPTTTPTLPAGSEQILSLTVPPINLDLLGLVLKTSQIQVNANAVTGNGDLLGNVLTTLLNTLGATPQDLTNLSSNLNALLGKVVGVLNASTLTLPPTAVSTLTQVLQTLALPNLVNATGTASAPILNLAIASTDGTTPPVNVNLLGLQVTTGNIQAQLLAQTGDGQILGNLLYNVANLLNPGGSVSLLTILNQLGL